MKEPAEDEVLKLGWAYGLSPIANNVVNLSDAQRERLFLVSSSTAVIQVRHGRWCAVA